MSECPHELWERESDVTADGSCPICLRAEIERLTEENSCLVSERIENEAEIDRLETHSNSMIDALNADIDAKHAALKIAGENIVVFSEKCEVFTRALLKAMALIDELIRENGRLCAASDQPPDVRLFAAKNSFDTAMKKLLGEQPQ